MSGKLSEGFATEMPDPSPGKELLRKALKKDIKGEQANMKIRKMFHVAVVFLGTDGKT